MDIDKRNHFSEETTSEEQPIPIEQLQRLVQLLDRSDVSEIEVKHHGAGARLALRKARASDGQAAYQLVEPVEGEAPLPVEVKHTIVAPLVGIFHSWAKPRGPSLATVGEKVKIGQVVGSIQSLNVINEVETSVAGRISEIFVQNGQPVEYGQPLMIIENGEEA